ncbi:MAG: hypothetical protein AB1529_07770 [Candidatus Micrarchaeota archaeon]
MPKKTDRKVPKHKHEETAGKKFPGPQAKPEPDRKSAEASPVLAMLGKAAPLGKELAGMLSLPGELHEENRWSFTSEKGKSVQALADAFILKSPLPQGLPEYGINISSRGSNTFCTFIDSKRKVIVFESVGNMHVPEGGSWSSFQSSLRDALEEARRLGALGTAFSFVICNEGIVAHF